MLSGLVIENFRSFGKKQVIPLAPITLIFGANSAGKSTIWDAIYAFNTLYFGEYRRTGGGVDFQFDHKVIDEYEYESVFHVKDETRKITIGVYGDTFGISKRKSHIGEFSLGIQFATRGEDYAVTTGLMDEDHIFHGKDLESDTEAQRMFLRMWSALNHVTEYKARSRFPILSKEREIKHGRNGIGRYFEIANQIEDIFIDMKIPYDVVKSQYMIDDKKFASVHLRDKVSGVELDFGDVGRGVQGITALGLFLARKKGRIFIISEPEANLYPGLQAELGSLFANQYKRTGAQFLIETHSEHLIRRIQKLIRHGVAHPEEYEDPNHILTTKDVCVLYVERDSEGSKVRKIELDSVGNFMEPWPDDFFDLSFNEAFDDYFETLSQSEAARDT